MHNISSPLRTPDKDIVLHEKYLPGQQVTVDDEKYIKKLKTKLEKLQGDYSVAHWSRKKGQVSASSTSMKKR